MEMADNGSEIRRANFLGAALCFAGLSVFVYSAVALALGSVNIEWVLIALVTVLLVSRVDIEVPKSSSTFTLTNTFILISVLRYGTHASVLLAAFDAAMSWLHSRGRRKSMWLNMAVVSLSTYAASESVRLVFGDLSALTTKPADLFMAAGSLALIQYLLNSALMCAVTALRTGDAFLDVWKDAYLWTSLSYFAGAVTACLVVELITVISFYAFIISVPILAITYFTYRVYLDKIDATNRHAEQMADLHLRTIEALAIAIDAKDEVTHEHVRRVQIYATGLARLFGLTEPEIEALKAGALLHDIGKLAVPDYILNKPGRLTPAEFDKMKVHTIVGAEILERVSFPYPVVPVVRHHHERWDGRGYPDGLKGDEIPVTARILTVSDCFDAVREDRQYRKAMTREQAIGMLKEGSGTVFDPTVVSFFLEHLNEFEAEIRDQNIEPHRGEASHSSGNTRPLKEQGESAVFEQIRSAHREVITLYGIAQTIGTSLDLRDTFAVFSARLDDIVSYTTCVLYLVKPDSLDVEAAHVAGRNAELFKGRRIPAGAGITGWVVAHHHSMHNCEPRLDFEVLRIHPTETYRASIVVPLVREETVLGALALYSCDLSAYTPDHLRLVEAVAKLASDAIANAVHHERTESNALTDLLTGLPNARALRYRFEEESDRARRHRDGFCVMMMDLDGFKSVNDRFGHQAGDHVLRELAQLLLSQVRSSDFVARYAGDEFVGVMQVGTDEAIELAQRIQRAVDRHEFGFNGSKLFIGISVGWACFGAEGDTLDELLLAADRAMYTDKTRRKTALAESSKFNSDDLNQYRVM